MNEGSIFLTGSFCLNDVIEAMKAGHSAFSKSEKNGKTYVSIKQWVNEEEDQYGNHSSISLNSDKTAPEAERKVNKYIGNMKRQRLGGAPVTTEDAAQMAANFEAANSNVNVRQTATPVVAGNGRQSDPPPSAPAGKIDDLPF